jgi:hypothetical protein
MKKIVVLLACLLLCYVGSAHAVVLTLDPTSVNVEVGKTFNIGINSLFYTEYNGGGSTAIGAWDVNLSYNPSQMAFVGASFGTGLGDSTRLSGVIGGGGLVNLEEISLETAQWLIDNQPNPLLLATLTFECLNPGNSLIELSVNGVLDENGSSLGVLPVFPVSVTQAAVPEPSTIMLIVTGLLGVGVLRKRFNS